MQLSTTECQELKDLLTNDTQDLQSPTSLLSDELGISLPMSDPPLDSQNYPSSPTPLLEALENAVSVSNPLISSDQQLPNLQGLKTKSKISPPNTFNKSAGLFLKMVSAELETIRKRPATNRNISSAQYQAIQNLKSYSNLVIKEADKGGKVVVLDRDQYKNICLDILSNRIWYKPISFSLIDQYFVDFYSLVDQAFHDGIINKTIWQFIRNPNPIIPTFYTLPKIYKDGPLRGRPIISGSNNITEGASTLIDRVLKPHVEALFSFVKDTM